MARDRAHGAGQGDCDKPEPLSLLSTIVNCLTVLVEGEVDPLTRAEYAIMRDLAVSIALDMLTERREAA